MDTYNHSYIAALVKRAQEDDSDAFAELYVLTYRQQYQFARNYLHDDDLAQDAVQEIYILALKNITKLKERKVFVAWLRQIGLRVCYDMARKRPKITEEDDDEEKMLNIADDHVFANPETQALKMFASRDLNKALEQLPGKERETLLLRYSAEMKSEDIARTMNMSVSSVTRYLRRREEHLRKIMKEA